MMTASVTPDTGTVQRLLDTLVANRDKKIKASKNPAYTKDDHEFHASCAESYAWGVGRILTLLDKGAPESKIFGTIVDEANEKVQNLREWGTLFPKESSYYGAINGYHNVSYLARIAKN